MSSQLRELDAYTIDNEPIASIDLMERAGTACTMWLSEYIQPEQRTTIVCGMGNNGGDGLVIARQLIVSRIRIIADFWVNIYEKQLTAKKVRFS